MNVFDIIGPVMIGPSSSHTAGASRAGLVARYLLGTEPVWAEITFYGSFAKTYAGHGTDRAVVGGILGFPLDDERIRNSFFHAEQRGLNVSFSVSEEDAGHPNTVKIRLRDKDGEEICVVVRSVGAGVVNVAEINGGEVNFTAEYDTTVIFNNDRAGVIAEITSAFARHGINIAFMRVFRKGEGRDAVMVIETDQGVGEALQNELRAAENIRKVITIPPLGV